MHRSLDKKKENTSRLEHGSAVFEQVTGAKAEDFINKFADIAPEFGRFILEWEFSDIYSRGGLDWKTREAVVIASCTTLGATGFPTLKKHVKSGIKAGLTRENIAEIIMQLSFTAGLTTTIAAMDVVKEAFSELDQEA